MLDIILFGSGITLLLYAIQQMESGLAKLGSERLQSGLQSFTSSPLKGILFGLCSTAILQSSSLVGLMTMAFVGAGVIPLRNAIGVILGSNLGTTVTGWLVALLGFRLDLTEAAMPLLGLGALAMVAFRKGRPGRYVGRFVFALGLLLVALDLMKESIAFVISYVDISALQDLPLLVFFLFGAALTAVIQSSSATMIITLSAINAGIIQLPAAAALIIGADLGTTSTVLIGSIAGSSVKKQVALVHFFFNFVTVSIAFLCLPLLLALVTSVLAIPDPLIGLVAIHSIFNFIGILIFVPFVPLLEQKITQRVGAVPSLLLTVDQVPQGVPDAAIEGLQKDIQQLLIDSLGLNALRMQARSDRIPAPAEEAGIAYANLKNRESLLSDYILDFSRQPLTLEQSSRGQQLLVCIRDVLYAAKAIRDIEHDMRFLAQQHSAVMHRLAAEFRADLLEMYSGMLDLLDENGFTPEALSALQKLANESHEACNAELYELIDNKSLQKESASTLLNINRELLYSAHCLLNALGNLLLPGKEARTVADLLSLRPV